MSLSTLWHRVISGRSAFTSLIIADHSNSRDAHTRVCQQSSWLLQQFAVWHRRRTATTAAAIVQNSAAAARVVTGTRKYDHITPVLRYLQYNTKHLIKLVYSAIIRNVSCSSADNLQAGDERVHVHTRSRTIIAYLHADDCVQASSVAGTRQLRSANTRTLVLQRTKTVIGTREFAVSAAAVYGTAYHWNFECCLAQYKLSIRAHMRILYFALYKCTRYY